MRRDRSVEAPQSTAVITAHAAGADKPAIVYRWAGDRAVLIEYGPAELDLELSFFAIGVERALLARGIDGLLDTALGFRSLLVSYDPERLACDELLAVLDEVHRASAAVSDLALESRSVRLPIAFDDGETRRSVERYGRSIREDAPNCAGGSNIDYLVRYNGMADRRELFDLVTRAELFVAFIGFFPGLPFMLPLDPRDTISAPKYNPTRTWTPEGAVGIGGPSFSIYPVESAGGYQLFGRSMPIYDSDRRNAAFHDDPLLLRAGDRVTFYEVTEPELDELRHDCERDAFAFDIHEASFEVGEHLHAIAALRGEADEIQAARRAAAATTPMP